jgi:uncharacterized membrane protein
MYGVVLLLSSVAWALLQSAILEHHGPSSRLAAAVGNDVKGKLSTVVYAVAIPLAFVRQWISAALYVLVALMWLVPDRRIESKLDR